MKLQVAGLTLLGMAMVVAVVVAVRFVFGTGWGATVGAVTGTAALVLWYVLPLVLGRRGARDE